MDDILKRVRQDDVKFICLQFTDVTGVLKSADIPVQRLESALQDGVWFDGSSVEGFARIQESDMRLVPDPATYAVLTWSQPERRRARLFCDIYDPDGHPFAADPRGVLKTALQRLQARRWVFNVGPEPEFFLLRRNGPEGIHPVPHDVGGDFDFSARGQTQGAATGVMVARVSTG